MGVVPTTDGRRERLPIHRAVAAGATAVVAGYLATALLVVLDGGLGRSPTFRALEGGLLQHARALGIVFLETLFVPIGAEIGPTDGTANLLAEVAGGAVPAAAYHLVPAAVLVLVAHRFVTAAPFRPATPETSAFLGGTVVFGFLPAALVCMGLCTVERPQETLYPVFDVGAALGLVLYPTTFGALGGTLAWRGRDGDPADRPGADGDGAGERGGPATESAAHGR